VLIQRPDDLDTAESLALLQEEIGEDADKSSPPHKFSAIPHVNFKAPVNSNAESVQARPKTGDIAPAASSSQKHSVLKAYRRAMGLCFKCGKNWGSQHQCSAAVQLHLVEGLMEITEGSTSPDSFTTAPVENMESDQELLCLSQQALSGTESNACFQLQGVIQGNEVLILSDSGSSGILSALCWRHVSKAAFHCPNLSELK
jgi:hypothetical protein